MENVAKNIMMGLLNFPAEDRVIILKEVIKLHNHAVDSEIEEKETRISEVQESGLRKIHNAEASIKIIATGIEEETESLRNQINQLHQTFIDGAPPVVAPEVVSATEHLAEPLTEFLPDAKYDTKHDPFKAD